MTTCSECLEEMATVRLADVRPGSGIAAHCSTCYVCGLALADVRYGEEHMVDGLANLRPYRTDAEVAMRALRGSERIRRRRIARWLRAALAVAACGVFFAFMELRARPSGEPAPETMTETIQLTCITPLQAAELGTPYLGSGGTALYRSDGLRTITIRGRIDEVLAARRVIREAEQRGQCTAEAPSDASRATRPQADPVAPASPVTVDR